MRGVCPYTPLADTLQADTPIGTHPLYHTPLHNTPLHTTLPTPCPPWTDRRLSKHCLPRYAVGKNFVLRNPDIFVWTSGFQNPLAHIHVTCLLTSECSFFESEEFTRNSLICFEISWQILPVNHQNIVLLNFSKCIPVDCCGFIGFSQMHATRVMVLPLQYIHLKYWVLQLYM